MPGDAATREPRRTIFSSMMRVSAFSTPHWIRARKVGDIYAVIRLGGLYSLVGTHRLLKLSSLLKDEPEVIASIGLIADQMGDVDPGIWFNALPPLINDRSYYDLLVDDNNNTKEAPHADGAKSIFICPSMGHVASQGGNDTIQGEYFMLWGFDSQGNLLNSTGHGSTSKFKWGSCYVWNSKLGSTIYSGTESFVKISQTVPANEVVLMTEKIAYPGEYTEQSVQGYANDPKVSNRYGGKINAQGYNNNLGQTKADFRLFTTRHHAGGHLLFADGHVSWLAWVDVQPPADQLPFASATTDANSYGKVRWSAIGAVN